MEPGSPEFIAHQNRTRKIVWLSCLMALAAYGVVGVLVSGSDTMPENNLDMVWPIAGLVLALGSLWAPRMFPGAHTRHRTRRPGLPVGEVLGWTLADGVGVIGVLAVALGAPVSRLWIYLAVGVILLVLRRPISD